MTEARLNDKSKNLSRSSAGDCAPVIGAERLAAALLIPAFLARRLRRLGDRQLGQLLEDEVFANFDLLAPEATISLVAADRLRRLHPRTEKQLGEGMITRVWERL